MFDFDKLFETKLFFNSKNFFRVAFLLSIVYSVCFVLSIYFIEYQEKDALIIRYLFVHAPFFAWVIVFINETKDKQFFTFNNCLVCVISGLFLNIGIFVFSFYWTWFICIAQKI